MIARARRFRPGQRFNALSRPLSFYAAVILARLLRLACAALLATTLASCRQSPATAFAISLDGVAPEVAAAVTWHSI